MGSCGCSLENPVERVSWKLYLDENYAALETVVLTTSGTEAPLRASLRVNEYGIMENQMRDRNRQSIALLSEAIRERRGKQMPLSDSEGFASCRGKPVMVMTYRDESWAPFFTCQKSKRRA